MQYSYYAYLFHQFLLAYNITYNTSSTFMERFDIFTTNMQFVEQYNSGPSGPSGQSGPPSVTLGMGPFADQSLQEFKRSRFGLLNDRKLFAAEDSSTDCIGLEEPTDKNSSESVPPSFDWRDHGVLTAVKDQGSCGSCWAFATVEVAESIAVLGGQFSVPPILSPKQLVDCCAANFGCSGGYISDAFVYMVSNAVVNETAYRYAPHQDECEVDHYSTEFSPRGCFYIPPGLARKHLERFLVEKGPLVIGIAAGSSVFQMYTGGIIRAWDCGNDVNHAVQLVGFGQDESGSRFWVVRNSWGKKWGENGYFRLERTDGTTNLLPSWDIDGEGSTCGMMESGVWGLE